MAKVADNSLVMDIADNEILQKALDVKDLHTKLGAMETDLTNKKAELVSKVKELWDTDAKSQRYIKNYKAETSLGIVQVESKVTTAKGIMESTFEPILKDIFGDHTDTLFEKEVVLDEVTDKRQVLMALLGPGINLNDIEISFKNPSLMEQIEKVGALTTKKVIAPKAKFLDLLSSIPDSITIRAEGFLKTYLDNAMSFVVVCGNRGKK